MSDLIGIVMRGFAAVCSADSPLRGAGAVFGIQGLWVRWCPRVLARECPSARMREVRRAGLVCGKCWLKLAASASKGSSPARIRTEVLSIMSRLLWAAELRGRQCSVVVPHCFRWYPIAGSCQSHKHLQARHAACFGRSLCSSSYPEIPCLWRLWGEVSGEVRRCQLRRVGSSVRCSLKLAMTKRAGFRGIRIRQIGSATTVCLST